MSRYIITHSLLSSWMYVLKGNPYEDMTTERDAFHDFMRVLRREPTETTEAMARGIEFEDLVTDIIEGDADTEHHWYRAAAKIADKVKGGVLQFNAYRSLEVDGMDILLHGRLDVLKAGRVMDIKFSRSYDRGKYIDFTQHPVYLCLIPEAKAFTYLISDGNEVWSETYRRDETADVRVIISDFLAWLTDHGLLAIYKEKWAAA